MLIRNVKVFDGTGAAPYPAEVLIEGNRIAMIARSAEGSLAQPGMRVLDGAGATLMPGLIEAHAHLTWPSSVEKMVHGMYLPPEQLALTAARNARILLDHGFTSAYSAGALSKQLEIFLKEQIDSGGMPGPRLIPSSIEREPPADNAALSAGEQSEHGRGPEAVRAFVKQCAELGAKAVKFLISGESALKPGASHQLLYTEEELRAAGEQARDSGCG